VVVDGVVYVGDRPGLSALSATDGTERWRFTIEDEWFNSEPAVVDGIAYVRGFDSHANTCIFCAVHVEDATERWQVPTGSVNTPPAVADGVVYVVGRHELYAFNATDGTERWRTTAEFIDGAAAVVDGVVYVGRMDGNLDALNAEDGTERWRFLAGDRGISAPAIAGGIAYVGSPDGTFYAVSATDGTERWRFKLADGGAGSIPAVTDGVVYISGGRGGDANLYALHVEDGTELWRFAAGDAGSSQVVAGDVVYYGSNDGNLYAVNAADGTELWRFLVEADFGIACAAVVDGVVYVTGDGTLYAIGARVPKLSVGGVARVTETTSLRGGPAPTAVERTDLKEDTRVTITGESVTAGEVVWWPVTVAETGDQGWVEASKLEPISSGDAAG
jgi:outer membrane protein assembly factor BamB